MGGASGIQDNIDASVLVFNFVTNELRDAAQLNQPRCNSSAVTAGDTLYVFGGRTVRDTDSRLDSIESLNLADDSS